jgi:hypothetical protein
MASDNRTDSMSVNRLVGYVLGAAFLLAGLLGFTVADGFIGPEKGDLLLGLRVNHLHNIVHLLIGAALIYGATRGTETARRINTLVGAVYALVGVLGFFIASDTKDYNILALNQADNLLHVVSAAVLLGAAFLADKHSRTSTTNTTGSTRI